MVLCLSQDGACTDSFANFRENSLKGDLSNDITLNPSLFSLDNTFNAGRKHRGKKTEREHIREGFFLKNREEKQKEGKQAGREESRMER